MGIVTDAFKLLEAEQALPQYELAEFSRIGQPQVRVLRQGTLEEMLEELLRVASAFGVSPHLLRGRCRLEVDLAGCDPCWRKVSFYVRSLIFR